MGTQNRIALDVFDRGTYMEKVVLGSGIKPGHLLSVDSDDKVSKLASGNTGLKLIALENWLSPNAAGDAWGNVFDAYTVGDQALCMMPRSGDRYNIRIPANAVAIVKNDLLIPDPANPGTIVKLGGAAGGEVIDSVGPSTPIVAAVTTIVAYDKTVTIPANSLNVDDIIHIHGIVHVIDNNSTDTLTITVKLGSVTIAASPAIDVADDDIGVFDLRLSVRSIGATGAYMLSGEIGLGVPGTATMRPVYKASTTFDTTAAHIVSVSQTWSVAHADNEAELIELTVSREGEAHVGVGGLVFSADEALDNSAVAAEALINARVL
jgi:hypothetical protein